MNVGTARTKRGRPTPPPSQRQALLGLVRADLVHRRIDDFEAPDLRRSFEGVVDDLAVPRAKGKPSAPAVYLSGNGPLVQVLQDALKDAGGGGRTFVQAIKNYVAQHSRPGRPVPPEHLIVYDEAQRAHDAERVAKVHGSPVQQSEPEHLLEFCERVPGWCVMLALIGHGQAIHVGEEGGLPLWREALLGSRYAHE